MMDSFNLTQVILPRVRQKSRILTCLICTVCNECLYAIVKVNVTEHNDVIKRHTNVITILRISATEVTALSQNIRPEMKGIREKKYFIGVRGRHKNPSLAITVWHQKPRDARQ